MPEGKPRPCDVFDVIAGIGPGGWLALMLGRLQMDVAGALAEWYNLIDCITPRSKAEELRMRLKEHSYYHTDRLVEQIDQMAEFYEEEEHMFYEPPDGIRCKHVFVAALKTDSKDRHLGYNLFRTYDCPKGAKKLLDGPQDPRKYKISHAFGVTGAAKYFTSPWKETSINKVKSRFLDVKFPSPHNITELALNEMWGLYGEDVEISVVVNIGPGNVNASDCKKIAKRFSWGRRMATPSSSSPSTPGATAKGTHPGRTQEHTSANELNPGDPKASQGISFEDSRSANPAETVRKTTNVHRHKTFGSEHHMDTEEKLKRDESAIEDNIRTKLRNVYPDNPPPYYRLAPDVSAPKTAKNDTSFSRITSDATNEYLKLPRVEVDMDEIGQRVPYQRAVAAA